MFRNEVILEAEIIIAIIVLRHCHFEVAQPPNFFWDLVLESVTEATGEAKESTDDCFEKRNEIT